MSADWRQVVRELVEGRRIILVGGPLAGLTGRVRAASALGAEAVLAIGSGRGTGELPGPDEATLAVVEPVAGDIAAQLAGDEALIASPPGDVVRAIEAFDPSGVALVFPLGLLGVLPPQMCRRPIVGHRAAAWCALEDKLLVDSLWEASGVDHTAYEIVRADPDTVLAAARRCDRGAGTVWAADASNGWHGGSEGTRWVRDAQTRDEALRSVVSRSHQVRVMPFIEGIPCSATGIVFPCGTAALPPTENVVLRAANAPVLRYAGVASWWDPSQEHGDGLLEVVRRVGVVLSEPHGYRGMFTVDGIMSRDGFVPTELNPRLGAGAMSLEREHPDLPLEALNRALIAGVRCHVDPRAFEGEVHPALRARRGGRPWLAANGPGIAAGVHELVYDQGAFRRAGAHDVPDASVVTGPGVAGGRIEFRPGPSLVPAGASVAPLAAAAFRWVDEELGAQIGPLAPAVDVNAIVNGV